MDRLSNIYRIPIIVSINEDTSDIGILWNEIPRLVHINGTRKQMNAKASEWNRNKWVAGECLVRRDNWKGQTSIETPMRDNGQIQSTSLFLKLEGMQELISNLKRNKYDVSNLNTLFKELIMISKTLHYSMTPKIDFDEVLIFNNILKQKIRSAMYSKLPEKYWVILDGVDNTTDDREIIIKLALDLGIPVVCHKQEEDYEIGLLWNKMPILVGITNNRKMQKIVVHWHERGWVNTENLVTFGEFKGDPKSGVTFIIEPDEFKGQVQEKSIILKVDGLPELMTSMRRAKYDITTLNEWLKSITLISRIYPRLALETHLDVNIMKQAYIQANNNNLLQSHQQMQIQLKQLQDENDVRLLKQKEIEEKNRKAMEHIQMHARQQAIQYIPLVIKADTFYLVSTPSLAENHGVFKLGITENWETRKYQYFTHNPDIKLYYKLDVKNVKLLEEYIGKLLKATHLAFVKHDEGFKDYTVKNSEWFRLGSEEKAKELMDFLSNYNEATHEKLKDLRQYIHDKILTTAGIEPKHIPLLIEAVPPIKQRVVTKFIEEKLKDANIITYDKLTAFRVDIKNITKFFKKDREYSDIPSDAKKLFEDDERVIIEINKRGKTEEIKLKKVILDLI